MSDTILIKDAVQTFYHTALSSARTQGTITIGRKKERIFLSQKGYKKALGVLPIPKPQSISDVPRESTQYLSRRESPVSELSVKSG